MGKQLGNEVLDPIFTEAKARFTRGAEAHRDHPFYGQFDLWADMREELLDIINYAAMQVIRIDRLASDYRISSEELPADPFEAK